MRFPARIAFPVLVGVATLTICSLGVRAELKIAKNSIADHRFRAAQLAQQAAEPKKVNHDEQRPNRSER
jgi:hypothetical protein